MQRKTTIAIMSAILLCNTAETEAEAVVMATSLYDEVESRDCEEVHPNESGVD